ncbi:YdcF family protein, partial [Mycobacterium tuberculosis]
CDVHTLIVVFGAAVWPGGRASPTLERRTRYALAAAIADPGVELLLSGAEGRYPPSEARVMASLIGDALARERVHLDEHSHDTLQT